MSLSPVIATHTILVGHPTTREDARGNRQDGPWAGTLIRGCSVQPSSNSEPTGDRQGPGSLDWTIWAPAGARIGPRDRVVIWNRELEDDFPQGEGFPWDNPPVRVYQVEGEPLSWSPGLLNHQVVTIRSAI